MAQSLRLSLRLHGIARTVPSGPTRLAKSARTILACMTCWGTFRSGPVNWGFVQELALTHLQLDGVARQILSGSPHLNSFKTIDGGLCSATRVRQRPRACSTRNSRTLDPSSWRDGTGHRR
jgi:hypothetical protein